MPDARPLLILNPRYDDAFVSLAERVVADADVTPVTLEAQLREKYPKAIVRVRDLSSEAGLVWYVYRDGRWVNGVRE
jgi:hypothetical protein